MFEQFEKKLSTQNMIIMCEKQNQLRVIYLLIYIQYINQTINSLRSMLLKQEEFYIVVLKNSDLNFILKPKFHSKTK